MNQRKKPILLDGKTLQKVIGTAFRFGFSAGKGNFDWLENHAEGEPAMFKTHERFIESREKAIDIIIAHVHNLKEES